MYPYDENNDLNNENNSENNSTPSDDGSYRMTRPDAGKSFDASQNDTAEQPDRDPGYRDANYTSETSGAPNFYSPSKHHKEPKAKKPSRGMPAAAIVALCLVCALVGGGLGGVIANGLDNGDAVAVTTPQTTLNQENAPATSGSNVSTTTGSELSARDIYYNLALKQVVGINTDITTNIWGMAVQGSVRGSGFVISEDGYILTNFHVIEDAYETGSPITVLFSDDSGYDTTEYTAQIIGFDRNNDVAVIKIDATGLSAATLGSSSDLLVGDTVYAVGNPLGELNYSMSSGIVSATDRVITTDEGRANMFQITAAVNEGNSGGPVYNVYGQVVGIVTAKPSEEGAEGIGFAIPIDDAVRIADDVINGGHQLNENQTPAYLGVTVQDVESMAQQYYDMPLGAYVRSVEEGSAAEKAGVLVGDIITQFGGYDIQSRDDLSEELTFHSAGETVEMVVYRSGEYQTLTVTLDAVPETNTTADSSDNSFGGMNLFPAA